MTWFRFVCPNSSLLRTQFAAALEAPCSPCHPPACLHRQPNRHGPSVVAGNFSCPSIVEWTDDTVKIVYTVRCAWLRGRMPQD